MVPERTSLARRVVLHLRLTWTRAGSAVAFTGNVASGSTRSRGAFDSSASLPLSDDLDDVLLDSWTSSSLLLGSHSVHGMQV